MLTCLVGETIIDTFSYKDEKLREWSNKGILICPVCKSKMLYCHGDYKIPYFRHEKDCDCPDVYSEGVTEEHLKGVKEIYDWLKTQNRIVNIQLEKWIPETKQRPDIYFEREENNIVKKYVIEYQCSPISTKYNERHDLYRLNNINDIWILGIDKYNAREHNLDYLSYKQNEAEYRTKTLEREIYNSNSPLLYFNSNLRRIFELNEDGFKRVFSTSRYNKEKRKYENIYCKTKFKVKFNSCKLKKCKFDEFINKNLLINDKEEYKREFERDKDYIINYFKNIDVLENLSINKKIKEINMKPLISFELNNNLYCVEYLDKEKLFDINNFKIYDENNIKYILFSNILFQSKIENCIFINRDSDIVKVKNEYETNLDKMIFFNGEIETEKSIFELFNSKLKREKENKAYEYKRMIEAQQEVFNKYKRMKNIEIFKNKNKVILKDHIVLIDGFYNFTDKNIRFKYIKDFKNTEEFIENAFIQNIYFLNKLKIKDIYLMLSKMYDGKRPCSRNMNLIVEKLKEYGFLNIEVYDRGRLS